MADKDITLRIRAKDTSKQTFDQLTRTMERLSKAMEEQRDAAKKGDASVRDLENSYNDLEMILHSKAGFLFRGPDKIKQDYPDLPAFEDYGDLLAAIRAAL